MPTTKSGRASNTPPRKTTGVSETTSKEDFSFTEKNKMRSTKQKMRRLRKSLCCLPIDRESLEVKISKTGHIHARWKMKNDVGEEVSCFLTAGATPGTSHSDTHIKSVANRILRSKGVSERFIWTH